MKKLNCFEKEMFAVDSIDMEVYQMTVYVDAESNKVQFYVGDTEDVLCVPEPRYTFYDTEEEAKQVLEQCRAKQDALCKQIKEQLQELLPCYRCQENFDLNALIPIDWQKELTEYDETQRNRLERWKMLARSNMISLGNVSFRRDEVLKVEWDEKKATVYTKDCVYITDGVEEYGFIWSIFA